MSVETTYQIKGMTCGHCEAAVSGELTRLAGVQAVAADAATGVARVTSAAPLPVDEVRAAVDEAGYELVGIDG
jgi:copper chaperone CopZ